LQLAAQANAGERVIIDNQDARHSEQDLELEADERTLLPERGEAFCLVPQR
jgi:hypothetical protein